MSEKPALYVVEKKEVVILVILFVLVTVLAFTMGVRYGESVGKKSALLQAAAAGEHGEGNEATGGTLGEAGDEAESSHGEHAKDSKEAAGHGKEAAHGKDAGHGKEANGHGDTETPKAAPKPTETAAPGRDAADKNADEFLLNALKEAGVEPPGGKAPNDAELPADVKKAKSGTYVIQVGSHPTKNEAMSQIRALSAKKIEASALAPFKDRQGEWHRVVIGSFKTKRDAEREANQLKAKNAILSYFVWRLP